MSAWPTALREHWLTGIECDHAARTDVATCFCARWRSEPQPTVIAAVERWIEHVQAHAAPDPDDEEAADWRDTLQRAIAERCACKPPGPIGAGRCPTCGKERPLPDNPLSGN